MTAFDSQLLIAQTDVRGTITNVNQKFIELSGYTREQLVGANHRILSSGYHGAAFWNGLYSTISQGQVWCGDICDRTNAGQIFWIRTTITPDYDDQSTITGYTALSIEVSDLYIKQTEAVQFKANQSKMFGIVAHELRTPAALIAMLLDSANEYSQQDLIELLKRYSKQLISVIDDVRAVINPEDNVFHHTTLVNLSALVKDCVSLYSKLLASNQVNIRIQLDQFESQPLVINKQSVKQILGNMLRHAIVKGSAKNIWIRAEWNGDKGQQGQLSLFVEDDGQLPENYGALIFSEFGGASEQVDQSSLGLNVSHTLARALGGDLCYSQRIYGGNALIFTFNACLKRQQALSLENVNSELPLSEMSVLLVEDDKVLLMVTAKMLSKAGAQVTCAENGRKGLSAFQIDDFDLILTDIMMPDIDGYAMVGSMRFQGYAGPIIGISAASFGGEFERLIESGADLVLSKPLTLRKLLDALSNLSQIKR